MNVAFDPWIPVVTPAGDRVMASLCEVLEEGERFADFAVRPHERVSLMRLMLCVAHAALDGPKDYDEWCDVPKQLPEAVRKYLTVWRDSFELFHHEKPWLQITRILKTVSQNPSEESPADWTPVSKLGFFYATGNNTTLFDHQGSSENRSIDLCDTILSLLTFQCFSPGGLISQVFWNGKQSKKTSKDSPCLPASMVHAFLRGKSLSQTICLNLPTYADVCMSYGEYELGRPVWELMPLSMDDTARVNNATRTYLGRLVPLTRIIRLHSTGSRMLLGDGLVYPAFDDGFPPEPTATVVIRKNLKKEERALLSYRPNKALWRELPAMIVKRRTGETGGPLSLRNIREGEGCDLIVSALARDQATIVDATESVFHISSRMRTEEGTAVYAAKVQTAENLASRLGWAVESYRMELDRGWEGRLKSSGPAKGELKAKLQAASISHYWTTVEKNLQSLMNCVESLGTEANLSAQEDWHKMLFSAAHEAFRLVCGRETPRQMRAFAKGWQKLTT